MPLSTIPSLPALPILIEHRLREQFSPTEFILKDESDEHVGHIGSQGGGRHFALTMRAAAFTGLSLIKRHQLVYAALHDFLQAEYAIHHPNLGYIHALKLQLRY